MTKRDTFMKYFNVRNTLLFNIIYEFSTLFLQAKAEAPKRLRFCKNFAYSMPFSLK